MVNNYLMVITGVTI